MQEIILYAVLAIIVLAMLYSVLGKDIGNDPTQGLPDGLKNTLNPADAPIIRPAQPLYEGPGADGINAIARMDRGFNLEQFLDGAKMAYGMILESFADGDKETLRNLLSDDVYEAYSAAIDERQEKGLRQRTDLARLISAEISDADLNGKTGTIRVLYDAELATALIDKEGETVEGDLDLLSRVNEVWDYERNLSQNNPNWILSAVEPANTEDGAPLSPDSAPDTE